MANTVITISNVNGVLIASTDSVPVVDGDTVSFSTADGSGAALYFSPAAVAILSPVPPSPVTIAGGEDASFTFTSSDEGAYSMIFKPTGAPAPHRFPVRETNTLLFEIDAFGHFGGGGGGPIIPINTSGRASTENND
jgi:hypothetical protein